MMTCPPKRWSWLILATLGWLVALAATTAASKAQDGAGRAAWLLTIDGVIGPATASYFGRGLEHARDAGAAAVVLQMDTPGGLDTSMREIIRAILLRHQISGAIAARDHRKD